MFSLQRTCYPQLIACFMRTCIMFSFESLFEWLYTTSPSSSFLVPSNVSWACHDLSLIFSLSFQRFKLSLKGSLMSFPPPCMAFIALYLHIFWLLASLSKYGYFLPFSLTPFTLLLIILRFVDHLLGLFMLYSLAKNLLMAKWFWTRWLLFMIYFFEEVTFLLTSSFLIIVFELDLVLGIHSSHALLDGSS